MRRVKIIGNWLMVMGVLLVSVPATAQIFGATQQEEQQAFGASAPGAVFQSTSSMSGSGSTYSANPELNADGSATYEGASYTPAKSPKRPGGIRKDGPTPSPNPEDPSEGEQDNTPTPLGDAVVPLMLMSLAFGMFVYFRRKRSEA